MQQNATAAGALPRTPLGELSALPQTSSWLLGGCFAAEEGKETEER